MPLTLSAGASLRSASLKPSPDGRGTVQQPCRPRLFPDRVVDPPGLAQGDLIGESHYRPPQGLDLGLAQVIAQDHVVAVVHPAVDLDHQPQGHTGEIHDVPADGVLAADLEALDRPAPQPRPDALLGQAGRLAKIASAGHGFKLASFSRREKVAA